MLAPLYDPCRYFDTGLLQALINLSEVPHLTSWRLRDQLTRKLSCTAQAGFLHTNYDRLIRLLRTARYPQTLRLVEELNRRRAETAFWNKVRLKVSGG